MSDGAVLSNRDARRLFLDRHALATRHPGRGTADDTLALITQLGFVQVDSIRAIERAHHHILFARAPAYRQSSLDRLQRQGRIFEHWTHDAALIPMEFYPHWRHIFEDHHRRIAGNNWWQGKLKDKKLITHILAEVEKRGPVTARDFTHLGTRSGSWWGWAPHKAALEYLWFTGALAIARRNGFEKVYDLGTRIVPADIRAQRPTFAETTSWATTSAIDRLGFGSLREIARFWNLVDVKDVGKLIHRKRDEFTEVTVEAAGKAGPFRAYIRRDVLATLKDVVSPQKLARFVNPFDPVLRDRARALRLFGFDYRIEVFTPAHKRQFGYYVLPILEGDRFIGRADMRADRAKDRLIVSKIWLEPGVKPAKSRMAAIAGAAHKLARFAGVNATELPARPITP